MISLNINNETSQLEAVVLGIPDDFGGVPSIKDAYDPKSKEHIRMGTFPSQKAISFELNSLMNILERHQIQVYKPSNIIGLNQIFARDIGFVVGEKFIIPNIIADRIEEVDAINHIINQFDPKNVVTMPKKARAEGGDVIPCNDYLFVGYSKNDDFEQYQVARTNSEALEFFKYTLPNFKVKGFELRKSDEDARKNALHLDCCFQPIGKNGAIMFDGGFKNKEDISFLENYFGIDNIIKITEEEMYHMNSNVFSISEKVIVSEQGFIRLNSLLRDKGFVVEEVPYAEIAKMEGLLRCSTLPLRRK